MPLWPSSFLRLFLFRLVYYFLRLSIQRTTLKEIKNLLHHRDVRVWGCCKTENPLYLHVFRLRTSLASSRWWLAGTGACWEMFISCSTLFPREQFNRTRMLVCQVVEEIPETAITSKGWMINSTIALKQKLRAHGFIKEAITQRCEYLSRYRPLIHFDMFSNKTYYATRSWKESDWERSP